MRVPVADTRPPAKYSAAADPWMQITFTIDLEHFRALRDRAEAKHLTVSGLVRESVIDSLAVIGTPPRENPISPQTLSLERS